jgi:hypothetical protein
MIGQLVKHERIRSQKPMKSLCHFMHSKVFYLKYKQQWTELCCSKDQKEIQPVNNHSGFNRKKNTKKRRVNSKRYVHEKVGHTMNNEEFCWGNYKTSKTH